MKVIVINFSGNVGKSTIAKYLLLPRIKGAELVSVESINADEGTDDAVRGKQFGALQEQMMMLDSAVIDVGASNVEDFMVLMRQYRGSHEDFDLFVVPAVKESKQIRDTIATIDALKNMGVPAKKIRVVFNKVEADETVGVSFHQLLNYHVAQKAFTLRGDAVVQFNDLYQRARSMGMTVDELLADGTDWKAKLRASTSPEEKQRAAAMISMRRLAASVKENLDAVFTALTK